MLLQRIHKLATSWMSLNVVTLYEYGKWVRQTEQQVPLASHRPDVLTLQECESRSDSSATESNCYRNTYYANCYP